MSMSKKQYPSLRALDSRISPKPASLGHSHAWYQIAPLPSMGPCINVMCRSPRNSIPTYSNHVPMEFHPSIVWDFAGHDGKISIKKGICVYHEEDYHQEVVFQPRDEKNDHPANKHGNDKISLSFFQTETIPSLKLT